MHIRGQVVLRKRWAPDPDSLRGERGGGGEGGQADGDRDYRGTIGESGTLTPDDQGWTLKGGGLGSGLPAATFEEVEISGAGLYILNWTTFTSKYGETGVKGTTRHRQVITQDDGFHGNIAVTPLTGHLLHLKNTEGAQRALNKELVEKLQQL